VLRCQKYRLLFRQFCPLGSLKYSIDLALLLLYRAFYGVTDTLIVSHCYHLYSYLVPSEPLGLEASFLSTESVYLKWRKPDQPNGVITKYVVYWQPSSYSFWREQNRLDWCNRDVKSGVIHGTDEKIAPDGKYILSFYFVSRRLSRQHETMLLGCCYDFAWYTNLCHLNERKILYFCYVNFPFR